MTNGLIMILKKLNFI